MIRRLLTLAAFTVADRCLGPVRAYLHCPPEWLDAADDVDVDALWPLERASVRAAP